jgi:hypothetical protein
MGIGANTQASQMDMPDFRQYVQPMAPSYAQYFAPYKLDKKGKPLAANKQPSQVDQMVARAQAAYNNINPATLAQLFPALYPGLQQQLGQTDMSSGAGRFLGQGMTQAPIYQAPMAQQYNNTYVPSNFNPNTQMSFTPDYNNPGNSGGMLGVAYRQAVDNASNPSEIGNNSMAGIQQLLSMATNK